MSRSMAAHDCSSSARLVVVLRMVLKRFKAMCVWFNSRVQR
jgi:hypothetical protein